MLKTKRVARGWAAFLIATAGPTEKVVAKLEAIPRLNIGFYPTPIEEAPRFREALSWTTPSVPGTLITRDDYTGAGFGGNKVRKLEFVLAKAVAEGADTVVIVGGEGSNHARVTALLSARFGLGCYLMLNPAPVVRARA